MVFSSTSTSTYKCPCGYEFVQTDSSNYTKMKLVRRLHAKRCDVAKQVNAQTTPSEETVVSKRGGDKRINLERQEFMNKQGTLVARVDMPIEN